MKAELIRIGNSRGIRIPKPIIEQCGLDSAVDLRVENQRLIISPERRPREDWEQKFRSAVAGAADENLLANVGTNEFDDEEWTW